MDVSVDVDNLEAFQYLLNQALFNKKTELVLEATIDASRI